jgi:predicted nucleotidyltransferase
MNNEILYKLKELKKELNIDKMAIFGSYARDEENSNSDIDLVIFSKNKNYFKLIEIENYISKKLNTKIDLGYYDSLKPFIKDSIKKDLIYV